MPPSRWLLGVFGGVLIGIAAFGRGGEIHLLHPTGSVSIPIKTWKDLRDAQVIKQRLDDSCGSAAAATILHYFYGQDVSEADLIAEVIAAKLATVDSDFERGIRSTLIRAVLDNELSTKELKRQLFAVVLESLGKGIPHEDLNKQLAQAIKNELDTTASFSTIKQAVGKFGFRAVGLVLTFAQLRQLRNPVIVYLDLHGEGHFSVVRGIRSDGLVRLADPSWGNQTLGAYRFQEMWVGAENTGKVLTILPKKHGVPVVPKPGFWVTPTQNPDLWQHLILLRGAHS
ncbi:putative double-glycine peptidase [Rhizobium sp. UGM030330-04]|nr:putative double-glycine peptidase [Rhizobium sp. UGM030330-04]